MRVIKSLEHLSHERPAKRDGVVQTEEKIPNRSHYSLLILIGGLEESWAGTLCQEVE